MGIEHHTKARAAGIVLAQPLSIANIERFNANLQFLFFTPWHTEALAQPHVEINVTRNSEDISITSLSRFGVPEAPISVLGIAAKQLRWGGAASCRASLNGLDSRDVTLHVPVSGPTCIVKDAAIAVEANWQTRVPPVDP